MFDKCMVSLCYVAHTHYVLYNECLTQIIDDEKLSNSFFLNYLDKTLISHTLLIQDALQIKTSACIPKSSLFPPTTFGNHTFVLLTIELDLIFTSECLYISVNQYRVLFSYITR